MGAANITTSLHVSGAMSGFLNAPSLRFRRPESTPRHRRRAVRPTLSLSTSHIPSAEPRKAQALTRRALLCATAATVLLRGAEEACAYSSPYRPGQNDELRLPDRLYEKTREEVVTTASGLRYFELAVGGGDREVADGASVIVNYTSRLRGLNGIKIWSSFEGPDAVPFIFRVGAPDVVPGVSEALLGMRVGGKRRAVLPPDISYQSPDMKPAVKDFFARRRLLSVLETNRDATIVFE